jgi:predicted lipoprotein with Yx(FWY)xxD motif
MRIGLVAALCCLLTAAAAAATAAEMQQKQIVFETAKGKVVFTHSDHQDAEKNCATCHQNNKFEKIAGFNKDAAHKLCIDCHKQKQGPTKCDECHEK